MHDFDNCSGGGDSCQGIVSRVQSKLHIARYTNAQNHDLSVSRVASILKGPCMLSLELVLDLINNCNTRFLREYLFYEKGVLRF